MFGRGIKIAVDIGGSGVRAGLVESGKSTDIRKYQIQSYQEFVKLIGRIANGRNLSAIGISCAGFVDCHRGFVRLSRVARWAEGDFAARLKRDLNVSDVVIVNDGDAHAAGAYASGLKGSILCLSLGTSVGMGIISRAGKLEHTLSGENWDIGEIRLKTRASTPETWWALGSKGLTELVSSMGDEGYSHYGARLGALIRELSIVFRPDTVALTGGIIHGNAAGIIKGLSDELRAGIPSYMEVPKVVEVKSIETAMDGIMYIMSNKEIL